MAPRMQVLYSTYAGRSGVRIALAALAAVAAAVVALALFASPSQTQGTSYPGTQTLRLLHVSDTHGKLVPHSERLSDGLWHANSGGYAKLATLVEELRQTTSPNLLLVNGDNFHEGAENFFTNGQATIPLLNALNIDAYSPGNWDFSDGPVAFRARFVGTPAVPKRMNFQALATGVYNAPGAPAGAALGERVLPPYTIKLVDGLKIAIIGLNDDKPASQAQVFTIGLDIRAGWDELPAVLDEVEAQGADLVVVLSDAGLAQNIAIGRDNEGIDVILSADTHEETLDPIVVKRTRTIVVESGEGSRVGALDLRVRKNFDDTRVVSARWKLHEADENTTENLAMKALVDAQRKTFLTPDFTPKVRPLPGWPMGTGIHLTEPIDKVIGATDTDLERHDLFHSTADNLIADAMRDLSGADIGGTNGFRYDIGIPAGEKITVGDIYHYLPVGAHVAVGEITGGQLLDRAEQFVSSSLHPNSYLRQGGWLPRFAGVRFYLDLTGPHGPNGGRITKAEVIDRATGLYAPLVKDKVYTIASCHAPGDPLDEMCRTSGVRNMKFLLSDGTLVAPLVPHQRPNPLPKLRVAPFTVMSAGAALKKYIEAKPGGLVKAADHGDSRWIVEKGMPQPSPLAPNVVQPLGGAGPDWLAAKRVGGQP